MGARKKSKPCMGSDPFAIRHKGGGTGVPMKRIKGGGRKEEKPTLF